MIQNLITKKDKEDIKVGYSKRVVITSAWCIFFTSFVCSVLLLPPFIMSFYRVKNISNKTESSVLSSTKQSEVLNSALVLNSKSKLALSLKNTPDIIGRIVEVYGEKSSGILINLISYNTTPSPSIKLGGIAQNRSSLLAFQKAIQNIDFIKSADIPVSDFAKDTDLPFLVDIIVIK